MKALGKKDILILSKLIQAVPEGLTPSTIAYGIKSSRQATNEHLRKLITKSLLYKRKAGILTYYHITDQGKNCLSWSNVKPFIPKDKMQRVHAIQVNAGLHKTSADRARETLEALAIPFTENKRLRQLNLTWKGTPLRFTTRKLIAYPGEKEAPRAIPIESVKQAIAGRLANTLEDFLSYTGLRAWRDPPGNLILEFRYWENGYPQNEIAEESLKDKSRIVYSYNKVTGIPSSWADSSLDPFKELENNSRRIDDEMKIYLQAIDDGELKPYEDELKTRKAIEILKNRERLTSENVSGVVALIDRMQSENRDRDYFYNLINEHLLLKPKQKAEGFRRAG